MLATISRIASGSFSCNASSACVFNTVSGVRNCCDASAMKRCWPAHFHIVFQTQQRPQHEAHRKPCQQGRHQRRQVVVAGHKFAVDAGHFAIEAVQRVGIETVERDVGHIDTTLPLTMATRSTSARIDDTQTDNAIKLPLLTCMYLGDRRECLFHRSGVGEISLRAHSPHKLGRGSTGCCCRRISFGCFEIVGIKHAGRILRSSATTVICKSRQSAMRSRAWRRSATGVAHAG